MKDSILIYKNINDLSDRTPTYAMVENTDLVIVKYNRAVSVLYGRCLHRGALMSDGLVEGDNIICGLHDWDYRIDTGVSEYDNKEILHKFDSWIEGDDLYVDHMLAHTIAKKYNNEALIDFKK